MKVTLNWLNEYVKIDDLAPAHIADRLMNIGLEVESLTYLGEGIENVVTGKVIRMTAHPTSSRLNICEIDVGSPKTLKIITAATNVKSGDIVFAALVGAMLPNGKQILAADFKGVVSYGMLCGMSELGIDNDNIDVYNAKDENGLGRNRTDGLLILPPDTKLGMDAKKILGLDDYLLDIAVTANRGDCHSVYGIARELAVALKRSLKPLDLDYITHKMTVRHLNVKILDKNICTRYIGSFVSDVKIERSPLWLRRRLKACGHSCRNNIVDITNYVLIEVGQPLHAFDESTIEGGITVRHAFENEQLTLLDDTSIKLNKNMLVIADNNKALALAGIMGGKGSGISEETKAVFLESARFARGNIRTSTRMLGIKSDSSQRFEKGVDYESPDIGRRRALSLIQKLNAGKISETVVKDETGQPQSKIIRTTFDSFKQILGIEIPKAFVIDILKRLGFSVSETINSDNNDSKNGGKGIEVVVPAFREDIDNFTDLIEEAIRFYGYDKLTESALVGGGSADTGISVRRQNINKIESLCLAAKAFEINNYSFISARYLEMLNLPHDDKLRQAVKIINPLSEEYAYMRTQLVSSMLETLRRNQSRQNDNFILFEIDNVFVPHSLPLTRLPEEKLTLCMGFCHKKTDFYSVKAFVRSLCDTFNLQYDFKPSLQKFMHSGKSADVIIDGKNTGCFGMIHPLVAESFSLTGDIHILQLDLSDFIDIPQKIAKFAPLPKFPFVERDLSLTLKSDTAAGEIIKLIKNADPLVKDVTVFDVYCGTQIEKGCKSLALKIVLQNYEKTMTEQEINGVMDKIIANLNLIGIYLR